MRAYQLNILVIKYLGREQHKFHKRAVLGITNIDYQHLSGHSTSNVYTPWVVYIFSSNSYHCMRYAIVIVPVYKVKYFGIKPM